MKLRFTFLLSLIIGIGSSSLYAGIFTEEYGVSAYEVEIKDDVGPEMIPYRLSVPERNGNPLQRINFVVLHFRGIGGIYAYDADERWHKWLYENNGAYLHVGEEYQPSSHVVQSLTMLSGMVLGTNSYPELDYVPLLPYGESAGGTDSFMMAFRYPHRTIGFIAEHTQYWHYPIPEDMKTVPGYFRWGEFDYDRWDNGYWDIEGDNIKDKLLAGAQWMCAAEPRQQHATKRYSVEEAMGYFSLLLPLRYDVQEGVTNHDPRLGPVELNTIARTNGWLGEHKFGPVQTTRYEQYANFLKDWESRDPYTAPYATAERKDKLEHSWMPDEKTALFWATKSPYGEHDLVMTHLDTLEDDLGSSTAWNRGSYFPNLFTVGQQVRVAVDPTGFTNTVAMQFWMNDQLVATDDTPPYEHAYTFTTNQTGVHFIYPIAVDALGGRCVGRRRVLQVYSNVRNGNTAPRVSDIDPFTVEPGATAEIPFTVQDTETADGSLAVSWQKVNNTDNISSTDYSASITGSGSNRTLNITAPGANSILWGLIQVSDGDMSVAEYVQINVSDNGGRGAPFFVESEAPTSAGNVFEAGSWSKRISVHVYDYDTPAKDLTMTAFSSNTSMLPNENIVVGGTGRFRYLQVKPLASGYCNVYYVLSDGHTSITNKFGIPADPAFDFDPVISDIPDQSIAAGRASDPIEVRVYDMQTPSEPITPGLTTLNLSVTSDNQSLLADSNITIRASGDRRFVTLKPNAGATGTVTLTAIVTDTDSSTATDTFTVAISSEGALSGISETLPTAYLSQPYSGSLSAEGGVEPLSWSLLSGSLPTGLSLNSDGSFSGTASATGTHAFVAQVVDANSSTSTASCSISADPWLAIPADLTALAQSGPSVTLSWSDTSIGESGVEVQRRNRDYLMWTSVVILAANSTNYVDNAVQIENQYDYRVRPIAGPFSEAKSVMLAVPTISIHPQNDTVFEGATSTLSVSANGGQLVYQWFRGTSGDTSSPIADSNTHALTLTNLTATESFWVRVTNVFGQASSDAATLTVQSVIQWPIYVDFGTVPTTNPDESDRYWNNVTSKSMTLDLISSDGSHTEMDLFVSFFNDLGLSSVNSLTNSPYTMTAAQDSLSVYNVSDGTVRLSGLDTNKTYDLSFYSSANLSSPRYIDFVLNSETQSINIASNESTLVVFSNIAPTAAGQIEVTVDNHEMKHASVNVMEFTQTPPPIGIELSASTLNVPEGSNAGFQIRLTKSPGNSHTVTVSRVSGDSDLSVLSGSPAVFTTNNWDQWQTITLQAAEDVDTTDNSAIFQCSEASMTPVQLTATEVDNDLGILVQNSTLTVTEGDSVNLLSRLNSAPPGPYTVTVSRVSGDSDISVSSGSSLVFTAEDYMNWHTSVVSAAQDGDQENGSAIIRLSSVDADDVDVTVTEQDDDYTVVATGLLAAWNFDDINNELVTSSNAYLMATGLVQSTLTHSDTSKVKASTTSIKAIDTDDATITDSIATGNYFYWQVVPQSNYLITITSVVVRTDVDDSTPVETFLLSDASGINDASVLAQNTSGGPKTDTVDLSGQAAFQNTGEPIEFRVYGYKGTSAYGNAVYIGEGFATDGVDDIQVYGTIAYSSPGDPDDADADGLPDSWEQEHFSGDANPDSISSNGVNTVREAYIAGLDPNDSNAQFKVDPSELSSHILQWTAVSGRVYTIYWASNLLSGFERIESNFTGGAFTDQVNGAELKGFYKIEVEVAP